jgi:hypothetical protein
VLEPHLVWLDPDEMAAAPCRNGPAKPTMNIEGVVERSIQRRHEGLEVPERFRHPGSAGTRDGSLSSMWHRE